MNYFLPSRSVEIGLGETQPNGVGGDPSRHIMMSAGQPGTGLLGNHQRRLSNLDRDGVRGILSEVSVYKIAGLWLVGWNEPFDNKVHSARVLEIFDKTWQSIVRVWVVLPSV